MESKFKIMALGGLDENGKNCYIIENDEDMIVIEAGSANFGNKSLGIDLVIPNFEYIIKNKEKLRAVLISHGHLDQMGALSYLINQIDVPIYGSAYTIAFLKCYIPKNKYNLLNEIGYNQKLNLNKFNVEAFGLSHAIYGNFGFVISNEDEAIVYTTDYNFNQGATKFGRTDIKKIVELANKYKIRALFTEALAADLEGIAASDQMYKSQLQCLVESSTGRLIFSLYSSNLAGMTNIIELTEQNDRKIVIIGRDLLNYVNIARNANYINHKKELFIRIGDMKKYQDHELIIVVAGLYDEPFNTIAKMAQAKHNIIKLKKTDTVVIGSKPYDEIEAHAQSVLDVIARSECQVVQQKINVPSHAYKEDIKMMINLFEPENIVPIKGEYRKFKTIADFTKLLGYNPENVPLLNNGEKLEIFENYACVTEEYKFDETLISQEEDSINPIVLRDREVLSDNGYVLLILTFLKGKSDIIQEAEVISGGLIQFNNDQTLIDGCKKIITNELEKGHNNRELVTKLKIKVSRYLQNNIGKTPIVLPVRMEVDPRRLRGNNNGKKENKQKESKQKAAK